jgi:hypothetical protein
LNFKMRINFKKNFDFARLGMRQIII